MRRKVFGLLVVAAGVMIALQKAEVYDFTWMFDQEWKKYIIPVVLIFLGLKIMIGHTHRSHSGENGFVDADTDNLQEGEVMDISVAFAGNRYNLTDQLFHGAKVDVFLGGVMLDLTGAEIADNCTLEIHTLMGGVEIKAPSNVNFSISSNCFLGGVDNKNLNVAGEGSKTIILKASCLLGGVNIK